MQFLLAGIFILLSCCGNIAESSPLGSLQLASSGIQLGRLHQQPQFAESIVDWLRDMKTRIFDTPSAIPDITSIVDSTKDSYERQKKFIDKLIVDMSKVAFDPDKDWGFRIGHWYLMRKDSDDVMSSFWKLVRPRTSTGSTTDNNDWLEFEFDNDKINISPSPSNTVIPIVPTTIEGTNNISPSTQSLSSNNDNETLDHSAEVILPDNVK